MKLNLFEAHDRLNFFKKDQEASIAKGVEDCMKINFDSIFYQERSPYIYIFAHPRSLDLDERVAMFNHDLQMSLSDIFYKRKYLKLENVPDKKMVWQPRLQKPAAQTNSYLFRAISNTDMVEPIWLLPPREMWPQYAKGKITENELVLWSVDMFINDRLKLEAKDCEDLSDERCKHILQELIACKRENRMMNQLYPGIKQDSLEAF